MSLIQAIILGLIEGVTEFLPVSSTGHLLFAQRLMGITKSVASNAFAICIQAGAIVAVLGLYTDRVRQLATCLAPDNERGRRLLVNLAVAFAPAAAVGLLFHDWVERTLFGAWPIVIAWAVGGILILAVSRAPQSRTGRRLSLDELTWQAALLIGVVQCVAFWPGTSRSLVTILGGLVVGLRVQSAVELSFLLGVVTLGAATGYEAVKYGPELLQSYGWENLAVGFGVAAVSAGVAVKWMVSYLNRHGLALFGYYRTAIAAVAAALLIAGVV